MTAPSLAAGVDLRLSPRHYEAVAEFLHGHCGIRLRDGKEALVVSRLGTRVRALKMASLGQYIEAVVQGELPAELQHFTDVLTTNKTGFFREPVHFEYLVDEVFPRLVARGRDVRIWSAACSSGEEPYTLAILVREHLPPALQARTRILATDISTRILATARTARYATAAVQGIPPESLQRWFTRLPDGAGFEAKPALRELVTFAHLNLIEAWPMRGPFDVILCRNVMIYFDRDTQARLVQRFAELLPAGGTLCVGHAESLTGIAHGLEQLMPATYRKPGAAA